MIELIHMASSFVCDSVTDSITDALSITGSLTDTLLHGLKRTDP